MSVGSVRERLLTLQAFARGPSWREVDRRAGLAEKMSSSYARSVGSKTPEYAAATKLASLFGVTVDWLLTGDGDVPSERRVLRSFNAAAVDEGGEGHAPKVRRITGSRKRSKSTGDRAIQRGARSVGASRP